MSSRRIPLFAALLAAALAPPALAADPAPRAIARGAAASPPASPKRANVSSGTAATRPGRRATPQATEGRASGGGEVKVTAAGPRPDAPRTTPGNVTQGSAGRQPAAGSTRPTGGPLVDAGTARPAPRRERTGGGPNGHVPRDTSPGRAERGWSRGQVSAPVERVAEGAAARGPGEARQATEELAVAPAGAKTMPSRTAGRRPRAERAPVAAVPAVAEEPRATSCSAALQAPPTLQVERTRTSLREFWWSDMARFFETSLDEVEPQPTQVGRADTVPADEAIRRSGLQRKLLDQLARARSVDLLSERELAKIGKALAGASPQAIAWLLRADSPSLRAHVWHWLATTPAGTCALFRLDRAAVEAAIRDRSVAVEHGEDLIFRPLGDYALAARARVAAADPQNFDALLRTLAQEADLDPRVRAVVAGLRVRRGHAGSIEAGLVDPLASVRGAVAAAALDRDRALYEQRMLEHAASDPADLVTELVVGELLGGPDGAPQGVLANSRDPRIRAALNRWRGRGDPMAPLPAPEKPLKLATPKREAARAEPVRSEPARVEPVRAEPREEYAQPVELEAAHEEHPIAAEPARPGRRTEAPAGPRLPGIFDDPSGADLP